METFCATWNGIRNSKCGKNLVEKLSESQLKLIDAIYHKYLSKVASYNDRLLYNLGVTFLREIDACAILPLICSKRN